MNKTSRSILTGLATGAVLGTAAYMVVNRTPSRGKTLKRNTGKALHTVGNLMENMSTMMK